MMSIFKGVSHLSAQLVFGKSDGILHVDFFERFLNSCGCLPKSLWMARWRLCACMSQQIAGSVQPEAEIGERVGRIRAGKMTQLVLPNLIMHV